jgi:hypothetical protein
MAVRLGGQFADDAVDLELGADIDAACRLVEDQHARADLQPFGQHDLLLVAADSASPRWCRSMPS